MEYKNRIAKTAYKVVDKALDVGMVLGTLAIPALMIGGPLFLEYRPDRAIQERIHEIVFEDYSPVGNGGALAEIHGQISPERRQMYDAIENHSLQRYLE